MPEKTMPDKEQSELLQALLDESPNPIFSFREDGTYLHVNRVFAATLGYTKEEIIGKRIWDIFPAEEGDKRYAVVKKTFETGEPQEIEVHIPLPTGDKYFLTKVRPHRDESDRIDFVICVSIDITELRKAQDELKTLTGILPICANCKNIRNDRGAWQQLEEYISAHSEAEFSHGICPECTELLYPGLLK